MCRTVLLEAAACADVGWRCSVRSKTRRRGGPLRQEGKDYRTAPSPCQAGKVIPRYDDSRYDRAVPVTKLTISLPEDLAESIRAEAEAEGTTVSAWLADQARRSLLLAEGRAAVAEYESEHGAITDEERARVRAWFREGGVQWPPSRSTPAS